MPTTIFVARKVVTMHRSNPTATAVAVRDGRVLAVGTVEECQAWGEATIDTTFADKVLIPGFVEAHGHTMDALVASFPYVGFFDYPLPDGTVAKGVKSYRDMLDALRAADAELPPGQTLLANSFDPIYFPDEPRLTREHLDLVSTERPIYVRHASGHLATVNSGLLAKEGIDRDCPTPGVARGPDGEPNGELQEAPAMSLAVDAFKVTSRAMFDPRVVGIHAELCRNAGVTTSTELVGGMLIAPQIEDAWRAAAEAPETPVRMVLYNMPSMPGSSADHGAAADAAVALAQRDTPKFRNKGAKLVLDGSIQGWTAVLLWPGYITGTDHGQLLMSPEETVEAVRAFHRRRLNVHAHCNGNATAEMFIDAVEQVLAEDAWLDHRHVVQHSQTTLPHQYRRMARLGLAANIFSNHIWYWGDQHASLTLGPDRARGMWACRTALDMGVPLSLHTDSGVTPIGALSPMWCAVNRVSYRGDVLGEHERITPYEALHAVTVGAAHQLHMDDEIGSIEPGKRADFAVLDESPLDVDPMAIRDIGVWGTVVGGVVYEAPRPGSTTS
ncbi:MAG: amidohydrolase [Ilumatobacteraceae bacterium]